MMTSQLGDSWVGDGTGPGTDQFRTAPESWTPGADLILRVVKSLVVKMIMIDNVGIVDAYQSDY